MATCRGDHGPVHSPIIGYDLPIHALICCLALASLSRPCNTQAGPSPASIQRAFSLQPVGALSCIRTGQKARHMSCMRSHLAACAVSGSAIHRTLWPWRPTHVAHLPRCDITSPPHRRHSILLCESRKRRIALNLLVFVSSPQPPMVQTRPWTATLAMLCKPPRPLPVVNYRFWLVHISSTPPDRPSESRQIPHSFHKV